MDKAGWVIAALLGALLLAGAAAAPQDDVTKELREIKAIVSRLADVCTRDAHERLFKLHPWDPATCDAGVKCDALEAEGWKHDRRRDMIEAYLKPRTMQYLDAERLARFIAENGPSMAPDERKIFEDRLTFLRSDSPEAAKERERIAALQRAAEERQKDREQQLKDALDHRK